MTDNPYLDLPLPAYGTDGFDWRPVEAMADDELEEHYGLLREAVEHHSRLYYVEFSPVIADSAYDELFHRLEAVENALGIDDPDSPTQTVGTDRAGTDNTEQ